MELSKEINDLTYKIIGICMDIHREIGPGFPEEYYRKALELEFSAQNVALLINFGKEKSEYRRMLLTSKWQEFRKNSQQIK